MVISELTPVWSNSFTELTVVRVLAQDVGRTETLMPHFLGINKKRD